MGKVWCWCVGVGKSWLRRQAALLLAARMPRRTLHTTWTSVLSPWQQAHPSTGWLPHRGGRHVADAQPRQLLRHPHHARLVRNLRMLGWGHGGRSKRWGTGRLGMPIVSGANGRYYMLPGTAGLAQLAQLAQHAWHSARHCCAQLAAQQLLHFNQLPNQAQHPPARRCRWHR